MKKVFRWILILIILAIFAGTLYFLYTKSKPKPVTYELKHPYISSIEKKSIATGSVIPRKEIEIKPQGVSGIVDKLYLEPGAIIKKGDPIAKVKIIPDMINLRSAESRVKQAELNFKNASLNYHRDRGLYEKEIIARKEYEQTELIYQTKQEELETAKDNLQLIRDGVTKKMGSATNTLIRSTIDGMVLDIPVKEGYSVIQSNTFNAGTTIAIIADMNEMIFQGMIDETEVAKLYEGMDLSLTIGALEDTTFPARLEYISPKGVVANGATKFEIKAALYDMHGMFIRSGYSANAEIILDKRDSVLVIDEGLLTFQNDSTFVEVETDQPQVFEKRAIRTGLSDGLKVEVLSGIDEETNIKGQVLKE
ncbi:MAG: efflux transporter periplasmic adaptor subunit [Bacteroidetes bacterium]|nr:MAG: efflux transporter periplasmic adaptor subunit [Bacteroidota bacterium]